MSYDLDAAIREELGEQFHFTLGGQEFVVPHMKDVDKEVLVLSDTESGASILRTLEVALGPDQWKRFDAISVSMAGVDKLYSAWTEHSGIKPGESPASTR